MRRLLSTTSRLALARVGGATMAAGATLAASAAPVSCDAPPPPPPPMPSATVPLAKPPPASSYSFSSMLPEAITGPVTSAYDAVYDNVVRPYADPSRDKLLPDVPPAIAGRERPTLVISLDGTLIESQWTRQFGWRYVKRPGVDEFLAQLAPLYELVLWTECMNSAETVIDRLDPRRRLSHRLYRDATTYTGGTHRKDLAHLNRDLRKVLILDCDPAAFALQPDSGIAIAPYKADADPDKEDKELQRLVPFLQYLALAGPRGTIGSYGEELQKLGVSTTIEDGGADFSAAVERRFDELRKAGKLPLARGGRGSVGGGGGGGTVWERMRAMRGA